MVVEIVEFALRPGTDLAGALLLYQQSAPVWAECPDLVEKYYTFDQATGLGGGVYVWKDIVAQRRWHGPDYLATIRERYGAEPKIRIMDAVLHVDRRDNM